MLIIKQYKKLFVASLRSQMWDNIEGPSWTENLQKEANPLDGKTPQELYDMIVKDEKINGKDSAPLKELLIDLKNIPAKLQEELRGSILGVLKNGKIFDMSTPEGVSESDIFLDSLKKTGILWKRFDINKFNIHLNAYLKKGMINSNEYVLKTDDKWNIVVAYGEDRWSFDGTDYDAFMTITPEGSLIMTEINFDDIITNKEEDDLNKISLTSKERALIAARGLFDDIDSQEDLDKRFKGAIDFYTKNASEFMLLLKTIDATRWVMITKRISEPKDLELDHILLVWKLQKQLNKELGKYNLDTVKVDGVIGNSFTQAKLDIRNARKAKLTTPARAMAEKGKWEAKLPEFKVGLDDKAEWKLDTQKIGDISKTEDLTTKEKSEETNDIEYTVKKWDTLYNIAEKIFGKGEGKRYQEIYEANKDILKSANEIKPGQILKIDTKIKDK